MKKTILNLLLFFNCLFAAVHAEDDNWWNTSYGSHVSADTLISWWGNTDAPSRKQFRNYFASQGYSSLLDVGFGLLTDYEGFKKDGMEVEFTGVEFAEKFVNEAKKKGVNAVLAKADSLPFEDESFDVSYARFVFEHLFSYKKALREMMRVAKKEVFVTFFIPPHGGKKDGIQRAFNNGFILFHNRYSRPLMEEFLREYPRVKQISWEKTSEKDVVLHILLKPQSECPPAPELAAEPILEDGKPKRFVFVTPSYNNTAYVERNLRSILSQKYEDWRLIYTDDNSKDDTFEKARKIIEASPLKDRVTLIHNEERCGAFENIYRSVLSCEDDEIILTLDGDDWLPHPDVLNYLNKLYQDHNIWMTYGSYQDYPSGYYGVCCGQIPDHIVANNAFRTYAWVTSHLRTFYAGLFKKIKLEDLLFKGKCYPMTWDQAMMFPMLEMSGDHSRYIPEIMYIYNFANPINDIKVSYSLTKECEDKIRNSPYYSVLGKPPVLNTTSDETLKPDIVVFSYNRPMQLNAFLESFYKYTTNYNRVTVIYRSDKDYEKGYQMVKNAYPQANYLHQSSKPHTDFKKHVMESSFDPSSKSDFIVYAVDDIIIKDEIDFKVDAQSMLDTSAYGFYYRLGEHVDFCYPINSHHQIPHFIRPKPDLLAWQFKGGTGDWNYPNSVDLVMYQKEDIDWQLKEMHFIHPNDFEAKWNLKSDLNKVGLCHHTSKMVNIPLNIVNASENRHMTVHSYTPAELRDKFYAGLKIDISPLYQIKNHSAHMEYEPTFIPQQ